MQPAAGGASGGGGGGGGGGASRAGLSRFRSAPATWLEALLEDEEEDPLKPNQCLTQLLTSATDQTTSSTSSSISRSIVADIPAAVSLFGASGSNPLADPAAGESSFDAGFLRQNSSPPDFLGTHDGFFSSSFGSIGSCNPPNFDLAPPDAAKRSRDLLSPIKLEPGGQVSGLIDLEMEKLLEDSVPCRVRAKRGFATHPRSIAERVRRTRISDRIRKLQELVPNMDKQTNTADMLEEAVEYVKYLQKQIEDLSEQQRRCKCTIEE